MGLGHGIGLGRGALTRLTLHVTYHGLDGPSNEGLSLEVLVITVTYPPNLNPMV